MTDVDRVSRLYGLQQSGHDVSLADCGFDQSRTTIEYAQILPVADCLRLAYGGLQFRQTVAISFPSEPSAEQS